MHIDGDTSGLSPTETKILQRLHRRRVPFDVLTTPALTRELVAISHATGRQAGVLVDRAGTVHHVILGDASGLMLPDVGRLRAAPGRLRGLRLIHTHLRNEPLTRDDLVDLTRLRLDMVIAICLAPGEERPLCVYYGHNAPAEARPGERRDDTKLEPPFHTVGPIPYAKADANPALIVRALEQELARVRRDRSEPGKDGRAILVHVCDKRGAASAEASMRELRELARTAGVAVADTFVQVRDRVDPKYVLGRGKLDDVVIRAMQLDADVLIFDHDLSPTQAASLARVTDLKVIDRTQLILDIFAQHAHSRDGKLQVELAQTRYLLPRLGQRDDALSRLTGGIGGRGPGETKLEVGKRRARERVTRLGRELKQLDRQRKQRRARRNRSGVPAVSVVGYTNAGKSTLLNALTGSDVLVEDKLFATLDTRTRRMRLPSGRDIVVSDTVGFIRDLPKELFAAFRSTFEEAQDADLLLHVVDVADPRHDEQLAATEALLVDLGLDRVPRVLVFNKADRIEPGRAEKMALARDAVATCALEPAGIEALVARLDAALAGAALPSFAPVDPAAAEGFDGGAVEALAIESPDALGS